MEVLWKNAHKQQLNKKVKLKMVTDKSLKIRREFMI